MTAEIEISEYGKYFPGCLSWRLFQPWSAAATRRSDESSDHLSCISLNQKNFSKVGAYPAVTCDCRVEETPGKILSETGDSRFSPRSQELGRNNITATLI